MEKTMRALNLHGIQDLRYEKVPVPVPKRGEVLLRVHACGICGSDIPRVFTKGTYHFPTIPGHEFAGEIVAVPEGEDAGLIGKRAAVVCDTVKVPTVIVQNSPSHRGNFPIKSGTP